ncbi:MAG TPA: phosphatase PAP2 family protein [Polyangiaceae bacterium]|jgi:membrane-associated phospholipid phosphatase|nr:phosphatase PAP2 family protein [Polyangiaceae bacterium]
MLGSASRMIRDARAEWGALAFVPFFTTAYVAILIVLGGQLRAEHWVLAVIVPVLGYAGARGARFLRDAFPWVFVVVSYDTVRYARAAWLHADTVLSCGLRSAELRFFSVAPGVTVQDWFVAHHRPFADLLCAVPYGVFAYFALIYASYLFFVDRPRMRRFLWAFAIANVMSYACWLLVPAAPPWYIRTHGCGVDLAAIPSEGAALARVDAALGMTYFHSWYSRASSVFGAMPSMHCAYPMLGLLTAWRHATWKTRPLHIAYVVWMATSALYLDHHWVLDVLGGWLVAIVAVIAATAAVKAAERRTIATTTTRMAEGRNAA